MKFSLGSVVATPAALAALAEAGVNPLQLISRHAMGDWGDVGKEDWKANEDALVNEDAIRNGERILSAYTYSRREFFVITEWDRSYTTVMLKSDY